MKKITRLEQALHCWEDRALYYQMSALTRIGLHKEPHVPVIGPVKHALEFRKYLLGAFEHTEFDMGRFISSASIADLKNPATIAGVSMGSAALLPKLLWDWTRSYRRIFRIGRDLQAMLNATTITNLTWEDMPKPPFECFVIKLDAPLLDYFERPYDHIVVSFTDQQLVAMILPAALEGYAGIEPWVRDVIVNRKIRPDRLGKLRNNLMRVSDFISQNPFMNAAVPGAFFRLKANVPMSKIHRVMVESITGEQKDVYTDPMCDAAMRQVVGLCMYLSTISSGSGSGLSWRPLVSAGYDPTTISNETEICSVGTEHILTDEEREVFGDGDIDGPTYELRTHGRRGHWRRPPYTAHDPASKKTVWVKPVLVRADRRAPGTLPSGSTTVLR